MEEVPVVESEAIVDVKRASRTLALVCQSEFQVKTGKLNRGFVRNNEKSSKEDFSSRCILLVPSVGFI